MSLQKLLKGAFRSFCKAKGLVGFAGTMHKLTTGSSERLWSSMLGNTENTTGLSPEPAAVAGLALHRGLDKATARGASQPQPRCEPATL